MTNAAETRLRAHGYRVTRARQLVLNAITELRHATPEQILTNVHAQAPSINLSTVYRALDVLSAVGLVTHAHLGPGSPTYHVSDAPAHLHLKCDGCGWVGSLPAAVAAPFVHSLSEATGFRADITHAAIHGRCHHCAAVPDRQEPLTHD